VTTKKIINSRTGVHSMNQYTKACLVTSQVTIERHLAGLFNNIHVKQRLFDIVLERDCNVYLVDTKIPDFDIWPAPLLRNPDARSKLWVFLVSELSDIYKMNTLPHNCRFFSRKLSQLSDLSSFVEKYLNPELGKKIAKIYYMEKDRSFVIRMENEKVYLLEVDDLPEADLSSVIRSKLGNSGKYFRVEQESGNWFEVPWDDVLYHCEPTYEHYKGRQAPEANHDLARRVGEKIRQFRTAKGLSIEELAQRAGMQRPNLSRLEHGKHRPSLVTIERLAEALDIPVVDLVAKVPSILPVHSPT